MKNRYLIILLIFMSCGKTVKKGEKGAVEIIETSADSIVEQVVDSEVEEAAAVEDKEVVFQTFEAILSSLKTKILPVIESTNFDDFIEAEDFKNLDFKALSLEKIYPHFNEKGYNFRAISAYKLNISDQFYTLVVTVKKGDHEMESHLINYDFNGSIINHQVVSYDEVAEGLSAIQSKITKDTVYRHHFFYEDEAFEQDYFQILEKGNLGEIKAENTIEIQNMPLVHHALYHLKLNLFNVKTNFIITKTHPNQPENRIVIIPEIEEEIEGFFALHTHILIINKRLGTIKAKYFESSKTNQWISDAIRLDQIEIETTTYQLSDSINAFGITANYIGASKANPYYNKTLSLFVQSENKLKKVLKNFSVEYVTGEWNDACDGKDVAIRRSLAMSEVTSQDFYDIIAKQETATTTLFMNDSGECDEKETSNNQTVILKFNGTEYQMIN